MQKSLLLFSGGPDSVSAAYLLHGSKQLVLFTVHEPKRTRNDGEVSSARLIAAKLKLPHKVINISSSDQLFDDVDRIAIGLGGGNRPGKGNLATINFSKEKCVAPGKDEAPFSLAFLHLSAAIYAATHEIKEIVWAVHSDDDAPSGWIAEYTERFNALLEISGSNVCLSTPFLEYSKSELLIAGKAARAPLEETFSCLQSSDGVHCGKCPGCVERLTAFRKLYSSDSSVVAVNAI